MLRFMSRRLSLRTVTFDGLNCCASSSCTTGERTKAGEAACAAAPLRLVRGVLGPAVACGVVTLANADGPRELEEVTDEVEEPKRRSAGADSGVAKAGLTCPV